MTTAPTGSTTRRLRIATLLAATLVPAIALAHPGSLAEHVGQPHGFADGFEHPFTGLDHLGAMLGVGIWSARHDAARVGRAAGLRRVPAGRRARERRTASSCPTSSR